MTCWCWDDGNKSSTVLIDDTGTEVSFHPIFSSGTDAVRGNTCFLQENIYYWEIKMSSAVYGTDMMIGIGTNAVDLTRYETEFCRFIGKDANSWGLSYHGEIQHNGILKDYTYKFSCGSVIGCLLDLWEGKLSFYINGVPAGVAFEGLLGKDLYPMISATSARTKMTLLCSYKSTYLPYSCCKKITQHQLIPKYINWRYGWMLKLY